MTELELSPAQVQVYELAEQGLTVDQIADKLGLSTAVAHAQITRIRKKRTLTHPSYQEHRMPHSPSQPYRATVPYEEAFPPNTPVQAPMADMSPKEVVMDAAQAGEAVYDIPEALRKAGERAAQKVDVHPMILLGVAIQFTKLAGGRMHAHQLIEDVYEALRAMVGDGEPPVSGETSPWPKDLETENATLKNQMVLLQQELADLRRAFGEQQVKSSGAF